MPLAVGESASTDGGLLDGGSLSCSTDPKGQGGGFFCVTLEGGPAPPPVPTPPAPPPAPALFACVVVGGADTCEPVGPGTTGVALADCQKQCHKRSERESARRVSLKIDDTTRPVTVQVCPRQSASTAGGAAIVSSTIAAAAIVRDHLHQHPGSRAEVVLCAGRHPLTRSLVLGPEDSGSESEPVRWRSDGDGMAVLDAGFRVSGWRQSSDSAGLWEASLPPGMESRQLWVNGKRAVRARSTSGAVILGTITESGYSNAHCVDENPKCSGWGASHIGAAQGRTWATGTASQTSRHVKTSAARSRDAQQRCTFPTRMKTATPLLVRRHAR